MLDLKGWALSFIEWGKVAALPTMAGYMWHIGRPASSIAFGLYAIVDAVYDAKREREGKKRPEAKTFWRNPNA